MGLSSIEVAYRQRTPRSAELVALASQVLPGGSSRNFGFHPPYPVAIAGGRGAEVWDVDGNCYLDLIFNGLSLIHGHAFPPVTEALTRAIDGAWAWPGTSKAQIAFAEMLCRRIPGVERVRFTNSGSEASMIAVKLARFVTGRPLILKAKGAYHGTYDDLEAGLAGRGELPGRTLLANYGDARSFLATLEREGERIAAVVIESVMLGQTTPRDPGSFLRKVQDATRKVGALFVLDDCLMLRLAPGGSAEKYGLNPDLIFAGKFVGGGIPLGIVGGRGDILDVSNPLRPNKRLQLGGSFNGNVLACVAGIATLEHLTPEAIGRMDAQAERLKLHIKAIAKREGLAVAFNGAGSAMSVIFGTGSVVMDVTSAAWDELNMAFHLACLNRGLFIGPGGKISLATVVTDAQLDGIMIALEKAIRDVATVRLIPSSTPKR